jgi:hypothetical protein
VAIAYSLLAGFPEVAYLDGLLALAWTIWRCLGLSPPERGIFVTQVAWGGMLGLLISVPLLIAFWDFLQYASIGPHSAYAYRTLVQPNEAMLLIPYITGTVGGYLFWFYLGGYLGLSVVFLGGVALWRPTADSGLRMLLALWIVITLAKALGLPGVTWLINQVPLIGITMFPNYVAPSWSMATVILATFAFEDWRLGLVKSRAVLITAIGVAVLTIATLITGEHAIRDAWSGSRTDRLVGISSLVWASMLIILLPLLCRKHACAVRPTTLFGLLAADAIAMFTVPLLAGARPQRLDLSAVNFLRNNLDLGRFVTTDSIVPNYGAMFGVASINYNYLPNARAWVDYVQASLDPEADAVYFPGRPNAVRARLSAYEALGVHYLMVPHDVHADLGAPVFRSSDTDIYALPHPAPYFEATGGSCNLDAVTRNIVRADCRASATLVRRELYLPGWRAIINGKTLAVARYDGMFEAVALPQGTTQIRFTYEPPGMTWAVVGCAFGVVAFLCSLAVKPTLRPSRKHPS